MDQRSGIRQKVTPHLKSVLKNYQHSATRSLHGPGHSFNSLSINNKSLSDESKDDDFRLPSSSTRTSPPVQLPIQQLPILAAPDTSCSETSVTELFGEYISCFVVGGEERLCLPQVLNSVLRTFTVQQIGAECDKLQIYCSRCTQSQLDILKSENVLPGSVPSCGLITKSDAERLCNALLYAKNKIYLRVRKNMMFFPIFHECFGEARGRCYPDLYFNKNERCIECVDCRCAFSPQLFVSHVHKKMENFTVHWGFDSSRSWRAYLHIPDDQKDRESYEKILDEMKGRYDGNIPFPSPPVVDSGMKRKQTITTDHVKNHHTEAPSTSELLLTKKQKLDYLEKAPQFALPTAAVAAAAYMQQHLYSLDPAYTLRYIQQMNNIRNPWCGYKPVVQSIQEHKMRNPINPLGSAVRPDAPLLQNPERVVMMSESERFERSYQPNVALAALPKNPRKSRYLKGYEAMNTNQQQYRNSNIVTSTSTQKNNNASSQYVELSSPYMSNGDIRDILKKQAMKSHQEKQIEQKSDRETTSSTSEEEIEESKLHRAPTKLDEFIKSFVKKELQQEATIILNNLFEKEIAATTRKYSIQMESETDLEMDNNNSSNTKYEQTDNEAIVDSCEKSPCKQHTERNEDAERENEVDLSSSPSSSTIISTAAPMAVSPAPIRQQTSVIASTATLQKESINSTNISIESNETEVIKTTPKQ